MQTVTYNVPSISCHHCKHTIETELSDLAGVQTVNADVTGQRVTVAFDEPATEEKIKDLLAEINYPVSAENTPA